MPTISAVGQPTIVARAEPARRSADVPCSQSHATSRHGRLLREESPAPRSVSVCAHHDAARLPPLTGSVQTIESGSLFPIGPTDLALGRLAAPSWSPRNAVLPESDVLQRAVRPFDTVVQFELPLRVSAVFVSNRSSSGYDHPVAFRPAFTASIRPQTIVLITATPLRYCGSLCAGMSCPVKEPGGPPANDIRGIATERSKEQESPVDRFSVESRDRVPTSETCGLSTVG